MLLTCKNFGTHMKSVMERVDQMPYKGFVKHTDRNGNGINGRPCKEVRKAWQLRYGWTDKQASIITDEFCSQLSFCRSDEARRLIMGVSK